MEDDKKKILYDGIKDTYSNLGTYEQFCEKLKDPEKRKNLYNALIQDYDNIGTYEEYNAKLGFGEKPAEGTKPAKEEKTDGSAVSVGTEPQQTKQPTQPQQAKQAQVTQQPTSEPVKRTQVGETLPQTTSNISMMPRASHNADNYWMREAVAITERAEQEHLQEAAKKMQEQQVVTQTIVNPQDEYKKSILSDKNNTIYVNDVSKDDDANMIFEAALATTRDLGASVVFGQQNVQANYDLWKLNRGNGDKAPIPTQVTSTSKEALLNAAYRLQSEGAARPAWMSQKAWDEASKLSEKDVQDLAATLQKKSRKYMFNTKVGDEVYYSGVSSESVTGYKAPLQQVEDTFSVPFDVYTRYYLCPDGKVRPIQYQDPQTLVGGEAAAREIRRRIYNEYITGKGKEGPKVGNFVADGDTSNFYFVGMINKISKERRKANPNIGAYDKIENYELITDSFMMDIQWIPVKKGQSVKQAFAEKKKEYEEFIIKLLPSVVERLTIYQKQAKELLETAKDLRFKNNVYDGRQGMSYGNGYLARPGDKDDVVSAIDNSIDNLENAIRDYQDALNKLKRGERVDNLEALWRGFADIDNWTMGLWNLRKKLATSRILSSKGNQEVKDLIDTSNSLCQDAQSQFAKYVADSSYNIFYSAGYSIPFTIQAFATYGFGSSIARGIIRQGTRLAEKFAEHQMLSLLTKGAARFLAINAAGAADTIFQAGRVAQDALQKYWGVAEYGYDQDGRIKFKGYIGGKPMGEAFVSAYLSNAKENVSERFGSFILDPITKNIHLRFGADMKGAGMVLRESNVGQFMAKYLPYGKLSKAIQSNAYQSVAGQAMKVLKQGGYDGFVNEYLEEVAGNVMSVPLGEMTWDEVIDAKQNLETFLSVGLSTGFMLGFQSAAGSAAYFLRRRKIDKAYQMADAEGRRLFGNGAWEKITDSFVNINDDVMVENLKRGVIDNTSLSKEQKQAIVRYIGMQRAQAAFNNIVANENASAKNGRELNDQNVSASLAYTEGRSMQNEEEYKRAEQEYNDTKEMATKALGIDGDIDTYLDGKGNTVAEQMQNAMEEAKERGVDEKDAAIALAAYLNARETRRGSHDAQEVDRDIRKWYTDKEIEQKRYEGDGTQSNVENKSVVATLEDGSTVYIIRGTIENNTIAGDNVIVRDETGETKMIPSSEVAGIVGEQNLDDLKQQAYEELAEEDRKTQIEINREVDLPLAGQSGFLIDGAGHRMEYHVLSVMNDEQGNPASVLVRSNENKDYMLPIYTFNTQRMMGRKYEAIKDYLDENDEEYYATEGAMNESYLLPANGEETKTKSNDNGAKPNDNGAKPNDNGAGQAAQKRVGYDYTVKVTDENGNIINGRVSSNENGLIEVTFERPYNGQMVVRFSEDELNNVLQESSDADGNLVWSKNEENLQEEETPQEENLGGENGGVQEVAQEETPQIESTEAPQEETIGENVDAQETNQEETHQIENAEQQEQSVTQEENTPKTALERIPKDEQGNTLYEQTDAQTAWQGLVEEAGNSEDAQAVADSMVEDKQKALDKAQKAKVKGNTPQEKIASTKANRAAVEQAQKELDFWKKVAGERARIDGEERKRREEYDAMMEEEESENGSYEDRWSDANVEEYESDTDGAVVNLERETRGNEPQTAREEKADSEKTEEKTDKKKKTEEKKTKKKIEEKEEEPKPIGKGVFGNIYDQFKGKVKAAFDFLMKNKSGDLIGVFHREEVGDIDLVWGDEKGGLGHILNKHIGQDKSFHNIEDAIQAIEEIISKGKVDFENGDKIVLRKGNGIVTIRKNFRKDGKKIADKNWVLTAYDISSADGDVSAIAPTNKSQAARTTEEKHDKDTKQSSSAQEKGEETSTAKEGSAASSEKKPKERKKEEQKTQEKPKTKEGSEKKNSGRFGLVSDERMEELKKLLRNKLNNLNVGIDPEILALGTELATGYIDRGLLKIEDFAKAMIKDLGDISRPYVKTIYDAGKRWMKENVDVEFGKQMSSEEEVDNFDTANFDKAADERKGVFETAEMKRKEEEAKRQAEEAKKKIEEKAKKEVSEDKGETNTSTKGNKTEEETVSLQEEQPYTITPTTYTNRMGKTSDVFRLELSDSMNISHEQIMAVNRYAAEKYEVSNGRRSYETNRGWKDRDSEGWIFRNEEDAKRAAEIVSGMATEDTENNQKTNGNEEVQLRTRASEGKREERTEHRPVEPMGEEAGNRIERTDGGRVGGRGAARTGADTNRSTGVSGQTQSEHDVKGEKNSRNYHGERGRENAPSSTGARIKANLEAIRLAKRLVEEGGMPTSEEMETLSKFSGWGGLGSLFNERDGATRYENRELQELLGKEAYKDAALSANTSYYTPTYVIDTMWDVAGALGFNGGNVLEGSAGIGSILGQMPKETSAKSDIQAVEFDNTTGEILSLLYPDAQTFIQGFENTKIKNGSVDLAITNVPFSTGMRVSDDTGDKDLSKKFHNIHDFCIAKNVRKLKEGGIGIFISSSGTLDNSKALRDWVVNDGNADFIGAFRLNNETFTGTPVTSDIIAIRKRVNGEKSANAIDVSEVGVVRNATLKVDGKEKTIPLIYNKYFIDHPEMMAGKMYFSGERGETYRPTSTTLYADGTNQKEALRAFVDSFKNMKEEKTKALSIEEQTAKRYEKLGENVKEGSLLVDKNGNVCIAQNGEAVPMMSAPKKGETVSEKELAERFNKKKVKGHTKGECVKAYMAIKDALNAVLDYQKEHEDDKGLKPLIEKLNKAYDDFVGTYGHLNNNRNIPFLRNDVDYASVLALENYSVKGDKKGNRVETFGKSDVFKGRVVNKESIPTPKNITDGVVVSMQVTGGIDLSFISKSLGMEAEEARREMMEKGLAFEDPIDHTLVVSYQYLSGNVLDKMMAAQEQNEDGRYDANIEALKKVMPVYIPAHMIDFSLGSSWIKPSLFEEFIKEKTGVGVKCEYGNGVWTMDKPYYISYEQNKAYGVRSEKLLKTFLGTDLIYAAMQNKSINATMTILGKKITDKEATRDIAMKIEEIRQDFRDWLHGKAQNDEELSAELERTYNEQFNNYVPLTIPKEFAPSRFPGMVNSLGGGTEFALRPHQSAAVVKGVTQPTLLAHEVGTGKTFTLITTAMEMRRLGTAKKPMIVVQNATIGQFSADAKRLYPNAKVLTISDVDSNAEGRKNFYNKIRYNDWDMVIVTQSAFDMIPDSKERQLAYIQEKIDEKKAMFERMRKSGDKDAKRITSKTAKEIWDLYGDIANLEAGEKGSAPMMEEKGLTAKEIKERAKSEQNAKAKAEELLDRRTDEVSNFDEMGIDALLIDEAHAYKHLGFTTMMQRGVKGVDSSYSKRSQGLYLKMQSVKERCNGKNVVFATGTPISNTTGELWTFLHYLLPEDKQKAYGIYYFDDFVRNFGQLEQKSEFTTSGAFKEVNRFSNFVNMPELMRIWSEVSDTVLTEDNEQLQKNIPEMDGGKAQDIYLPQTISLRSVMKYVREQLKKFDMMDGKQKKENSHIPLTMYRIATAAAVDPRLVLDDAVDDEKSKTNETVRQTLRSLEETKDYKGTVAIFADHYQNKNSGFNLYEDIKKKLIDKGVRADQIVIMVSRMPVKKKNEIFDKVNSGEVRVVMGSTQTLGTGVNIQERLHTLIHVDAPVRPMDYTQRNGRILRQGNMHKEWGKKVRVIRMGVEDSLDVTAYQRLKTKGAFVDAVMHGMDLLKDPTRNRMLEEEDDLFGDTVANLSGSEYAILKNQAERDLRKYQSRKNQWEADQRYISVRKSKLGADIEFDKKQIAELTQSVKTLEERFPDGKFKSIKIGKNEFSSVKEMGDYIKDFNKKILEDKEAVRSSATNETRSRQVKIDIDGVTFTVKAVTIKGVTGNGRSLFSKAQTIMTYDCEELGLKDVAVYQMLLRNALEDITENVISKKEAREKLRTFENALERDTQSLSTLKEREGRPFEYEEELKTAEQHVAEYTEKMKEEMEAKEAKYAEMDAQVEAANGDDIFIDEEDDDNVDYQKVEDGDERSLDEREKALRDMVVDKLKDSGMDVVTDEEDGQRVLDMANGGERVSEHRVYHGSGADFDHFDHSHMGEGEGAQAYGWGTYVTEVEGIGRTYAKNAFFSAEKRRTGKDETPLDKAISALVGQEIYNSTANNFEQRKAAAIDAYKSVIHAAETSFSKETNDNIVSFRREIIEDSKSILKVLGTLTEEKYNEERMKQGRMRHIYTIEIPEDTGDNYIDWANALTDGHIGRIREYLRANYRKNKVDDFDASMAEVKRASNAWTRRGENVYKTLTSLLGTDKNVSKALSEMGFVGIKYPADYRRGGRKDGKKNYVIFNENDAKITDHVRFFRTRNGEAYGYTVGGKIYIDPRIANAETPIHEYAHLWATAMRKGNPTQWKNITSLMKTCKDVWEEVKKNYPELKTDEEIADEVLAQYSGRRGAERLREMQREVLDGEGSVFDKAQKVGLLGKLKQAIDKVWEWVGDFLHIKYESAEQVADQVMRDLWNGVDPRKSGVDEKVREQSTSTSSPTDVSEKELLRQNDTNTHDATANNEKKRKTVDKIGGKLHLGNVVVHETADGLTGSRATAKGWFDTMTGQMHVVLSNNADESDVTKTMMHEAVAHYGLRAMLGNSAFTSMINDLIGEAHKSNKEVYEKIMSLVSNHGFDQSVAAEEYLASLAEEMESSSAARKMLAGVRYMIYQLLEAVGIRDKERPSLSDNELKYILWQSYQSRKKGEKNKFIFAADKARMEGKLGVGAFDKNDESRLLFRQDFEEQQKLQVRDEYERMINKESHKFLTAWVDNMQSLQDFQGAIERAIGKKISDNDNAYYAAIALSSKNYAMMDLYKGTFYKRLLDSIGDFKETDISYEEVRDYVMFKHGLERNEYMRNAEADKMFAEYKEKHPNGQKTRDDFHEALKDKDYAGLRGKVARMTDADDVETDYAEDYAENYVESVEREAGSLCDSLWDAINDCTRESLRMAYEAGMMSKETYDKVCSMYQYYVPLRGFEETTSDEVYNYFGGDSRAMSAVMKKAKGRTSEADDPFANIGNMAELAIMQGNRNRYKQKLLNLAMNHPSDLISINEMYIHLNPSTGEWEAVPYPSTEGMDETDAKDTIDKFIEDMEEKIETNPEEYKKSSEKENIPYRVIVGKNEHQIHVKRNGKDYILTINGNPMLAQAVNGLMNSDTNVNPFVAAIKKGTHALAALATHKNILFSGLNFIRDLSYSTNISVKENGAYAKRYRKNLGVTMKNIFGLISRQKGHRLDMSNPMDRMFHEFIVNGGETGYTFMHSVEEYKGEIANALKKKNGKARHYVVNDIWNAYVKAADFVNRVSEDIVRFTAYMTSRQEGRSIERAVQDAKEVSVNFNRKGAGSKSAGRPLQNGNVMNFFSSYIAGFFKDAYMFMNAGIQGLNNFAKLAYHHPKAFAAWVAVPFALGAIAPILGTTMCGAFGGDPDDYYNIPEYKRRQNICIYVGNGNWLTIPLAIELRSFYGMGELISSQLTGGTNYEGYELTKKIGEQISQIFPIDVMESGWTTFVPSFFRPVAEVMVNKDWTGMPVYKESYNRYTPAWQNHYNSTNGTLVNAARWLNEVGGGDDVSRGTEMLQMNPAIAEHLIEGYTSGTGTLFNRTYKTIRDAVKGEEMQLRNVPFVNIVLTHTDDRTQDMGLNERFFNEKQKGDKLIHDYDGYVKQMLSDEKYKRKVEEINNSPKIILYALWKNYERMVKPYKDELKTETDAVRTAAIKRTMAKLKKMTLEASQKIRESGNINEADEILNHAYDGLGD